MDADFFARVHRPGSERGSRRQSHRAINTALQRPLYSFELATRQATTVIENFRRTTRFVTWAWAAAILSLGIALGSFAMYFSFPRQITALNDRFDHLEQLLLTPTPAAAPTPQTGRSMGSTKQSDGFNARPGELGTPEASHNHSLDGDDDVGAHSFNDLCLARPWLFMMAVRM